MDPISLSLEHQAWARKRWFLIGWLRAWENEPWKAQGRHLRHCGRRLYEAWKRERATAKRMHDRPEALRLPPKARVAVKYLEAAEKLKKGSSS